MDELEIYQKAAELERSKTESKEFIKRKQLQAQTEMAGMADVAMASLYQMLTSDDPSVRIKALTLWFTKMVPTVAPEKAELEKEVIDAGVGFDEMAKQIEELKKKARSE